MSKVTSNFRRDFALLLLVNAIVLVFSFSLYKILPVIYGEQAFYEFSVAKRFQAFALPLMFCGLATVLPRNISQGSSAVDDFAGAFLLMVVCGVATLSSAWIFWDWITQGIGNSGLFGIFAFLCIPPALSGLLFSYYRGLGQVAEGLKVLVLFNIAAPAAALTLSGELLSFARNSAAVAFAIAALMVIRSIRGGTYGFVVQHAFQRAAQLARSGAPRIPGDVLFQGILTAPVLVSSHAHGIEVAGVTAFMMSTLTLLAFPLKPISTLLLTEVAKTPTRALARKMFLTTLGWAALSSAGISGLFFALHDRYFGFFGISLDLSAAALFSAATAGYIVYIAVRSFVDALGRDGAPSVPPFVGVGAFTFCYVSVSAQFDGVQALLLPLAVGVWGMALTVVWMSAAAVAEKE